MSRQLQSSTHVWSMSLFASFPHTCMWIIDEALRFGRGVVHSCSYICTQCLLVPTIRDLLYCQCDRVSLLVSSCLLDSSSLSLLDSPGVLADAPAAVQASSAAHYLPVGSCGSAHGLGASATSRREGTNALGTHWWPIGMALYVAASQSGTGCSCALSAASFPSCTCRCPSSPDGRSGCDELMCLSLAQMSPHPWWHAAMHCSRHHLGAYCHAASAGCKLSVNEAAWRPPQGDASLTRAKGPLFTASGQIVRHAAAKAGVLASIFARRAHHRGCISGRFSLHSHKCFRALYSFPPLPLRPGALSLFSVPKGGFFGFSLQPNDVLFFQFFP